jgi:hypothetical protein
MKKIKHIASQIIFSDYFLFTLIAITCLVCGMGMGVKATISSACRAGVGEYVINPKTGKPIFQFKTNQTEIGTSPENTASN